MRKIKVILISKKGNLDYIQSLAEDHIVVICNNEGMVNRLNTWYIKQNSNA